MCVIDKLAHLHELFSLRYLSICIAVDFMKWKASTQTQTCQSLRYLSIFIAVDISNRQDITSTETCQSLRYLSIFIAVDYNK